MPPKSTLRRLQDDLADLEDRLALVLRGIPAKYVDWGGSITIVGFPDYSWEEPKPQQVRLLHSIKRDYEDWYELLLSVFRGAPSDIEGKLKDADCKFRIWLELDRNWALKANADENESNFRENVSAFKPLFEVLSAEEDFGVIIVPDTNSIVSNPDPVSYRSIGGEAFTLLLLPTVLAELDRLKNLHRNPEFRDKVKKVIARVKGWRKQGSLCDGVTVDKTITVKAVAKDPNMNKALTWLDPEIQDDRLIASLLETQSMYPGGVVVLVTGDINLLNKADAVRISHAEI